MSNSGAEVMLRVESLGKRYVVPRPHAKTATARARLAAHLKEYFSAFHSVDESDYFWALRDFSLEARQGEIIGILGKNGSGKSTLLKILSGVTQPTEGRAMLRGKVGSLLEVGTGFHPDLTGRENVYMAGALLGIKRQEIRGKFDEIVDFSGIGRFIDVPVKRYSSGMYVRLAYAVASMLRSDILILDEVLSVGDAEFREKSQRNIEKVTRDGRCVLFVSHNIRAVRQICHRGIILENGRAIFDGTAADASARYMQRLLSIDAASNADDASSWPHRHDLRAAARVTDSEARVLEWASTHHLDGMPATAFQTGKGIRIRIGFRSVTAANPYFSVLIHNMYGDRVATLHSTHSGQPLRLCGGSGVVECVAPQLLLGEGTYWLMIDYGDFGGSRSTMTSLDCVSAAGKITVALDGYLSGIGLGEFQGAALKSSWSLQPRAT